MQKSFQEKYGEQELRKRRKTKEGELEEISLRTWSLLSGSTVAPRHHMRDCQLHLRKSMEKRRSWIRIARCLPFFLNEETQSFRDKNRIFFYFGVSSYIENFPARYRSIARNNTFTLDLLLCRVYMIALFFAAKLISLDGRTSAQIRYLYAKHLSLSRRWLQKPEDKIK